jgi:hypothetical protein
MTYSTMDAAGWALSALVLIAILTHYLYQALVRSQKTSSTLEHKSATLRVKLSQVELQLAQSEKEAEQLASKVRSLERKLGAKLKPKVYQDALNYLENDQGAWFVNLLIESELAKLLRHHTRQSQQEVEEGILELGSDDEVSGEAGSDGEDLLEDVTSEAGEESDAEESDAEESNAEESNALESEGEETDGESGSAASDEDSGNESAVADENPDADGPDGPDGPDDSALRLKREAALAAGKTSEVRHKVDGAVIRENKEVSTRAHAELAALAEIASKRGGFWAEAGAWANEDERELSLASATTGSNEGARADADKEAKEVQAEAEKQVKESVHETDIAGAADSTAAAGQKIQS